jgi:sulfite reductase (ferredoxin)
MLGCPLAGVAADEIFDTSGDLAALSAEVVGDPQYSNLPRKFKTSVCGCGRHCTNHEINDVSFVAVEKDGELGYDLWVGGGLSTNPHFGIRLGVFVSRDRLLEAWRGVVSVFRDYGYRKVRNRARLKFLVADWGAEKFRQVLESEYLSAPLPDGPEPAKPTGPRDHLGVQRQKDGRNSVGFALRTGRTSGEQLTRVADLAERYGSGQAHATAQQQLVILGVPDESVDELVAALKADDLIVHPSPFRRGTMACTGLEFCKLAIVETKARANWLIDELERRLPDFDTPITVNLNGCPNSCARFQVADIGFKGMMMRERGGGGDVEGFQVHLGGSLGADTAFGRKFRGLRVSAEDAADYIERVLRGYLERRKGEESFADYVGRADEAWLQ